MDKHAVLNHLPGGVFFAGGLKGCTNCSFDLLFLPNSDEYVDKKIHACKELSR